MYLTPCYNKYLRQQYTLGAPDTDGEQEFGLRSIIQPPRASGKMDHRNSAVHTLGRYSLRFSTSAQVLHQYSTVAVTLSPLYHSHNSTLSI